MARDLPISSEDRLIDEQRALEIETLRSARARYLELQERAARAGAVERLSGYDRLLYAAVPLVAQALQEWVKDMEAQKGKAPMGLLPVISLGPQACAYIGLSTALEHIHKRKNVRDAFIAIGERVQEELWVSELFEADPKTWGRLFPRIMKDTGGSAPKVLRGARRAAKRFCDKTWRKWDVAKCIRVGEPILNAALLGSGVLQVLTIGQDRYLGLSDDAAEWLKDRQEAQAYSHPSHVPMVCPPRPWGPRSGPYVTKAMNRKTPLMRSRQAAVSRPLKDALGRGEAQGVLDALNLINATPWRINTAIMGAVQWVWEQGLEPSEGLFSGLDGFPRSTIVPIPPLPEDQEDEVAMRRAKAERYEAMQRNREAETEALSFLNDMSTARQYADRERFWLPHNIDFRGRIYPIPHLNQQRTDYVKGMLEFADAKPLGHQGAYWLAVHLANCGDFDKVSKRPIKERYNWTRDNRHTIKEIANDYRSNLLWLEADKPFQFLAACIEYAAFMDSGPSYGSRCAIALDGSNSGLQHYSASLRAEQDAFHVNLRDCAEGQDIYRSVAEKCISIIERSLSQGTLREDQEPLARLWLSFGIDRKLVKRPVMTFPYAAETYGFADQIIEDTIKPLNREVREGKRTEHPFGDPATAYRAASYLAKVVWQAVNEVVSRAGEGMEFFKATASVLAHEGKPVRWTSPIGIPVVHQYLEYETVRPALRLYAPKTSTVAAMGTEGDLSDPWVSVQFNLRIRETGRIKKTKQRSAVAPNVIHSLDASHMMLTVLKAHEEGINTFCLIHDSFATHAADTERFSSIIREAFADMYENYNVYEVVRDEALKVLSDTGADKLPPLPQMGCLDLTEVTRSQFAFS